MERHRVEVRGVEFPGRGTRSQEPRAPSLMHLAEDVADQVTVDLARRFHDLRVYLYGHSFGGTVAVEAGRILEARGIDLAGVVVAACVRPGLGDRAGSDSDQRPPQSTRETLRVMGSVLTALMDDDVYAARTEAAVAADQALLDAHPFEPNPVLTCGLLAVGSTTDAIPAEWREGWRSVGRDDFSTATVVGGGHMFHLARPTATTELVAHWITGQASRRDVVGG